VKLKVLILIISLSVLLVACSSNNDATKAVDPQEIEDMVKEATDLIVNDQLDDAIAMYEQVVELDDNEAYRNKLVELQERKEKRIQQELHNNEMMEQLDEIIVLLTNIQRDKLSKSFDDIAFIDLHYIMNDLIKASETLENIQAEGSTPISDYLIDVKKAHQRSYSLLALRFNDEYVTSMQAARNLDKSYKGSRSGTLGEFIDVMNALDDTLKDMAISSIDLYVNGILNVERPNQ